MDFASKLNAAEVLRLVPLILKEPSSVPGAAHARLKVKVAPASGSVADKVPTTVLIGWFSLTELEERDMPVGASLRLFTLTEKSLSKVSPPWSVTRMQMLYVDFASKLNAAEVLRLVPLS